MRPFSPVEAQRGQSPVGPGGQLEVGALQGGIGGPELLSLGQLLAQQGPSMDLLALGARQGIQVRSNAVNLILGVDSARKTSVAQVIDSLKG